MSVGIATMGMFNPCCGSRTVGGGGAPPYRREDEHVAPRILVTKFEMETMSVNKKMFENMSIKLVNEEDQEDKYNVKIKRQRSQTINF